MSSTVARLGRDVTIRLRGLDVAVELEVDYREHGLREQGLSLTGLSTVQFGALLAIPRWSYAAPAELPAGSRALARRHPDLVEHESDGRVRRRVGPPVWVEMVTLPVARWRAGLSAIGRFAPYSARRLLLTRVPDDTDDLRVQATYWGVGVRIERADGFEDLVEPEPFVPQRYTGASWAFAEQTLAAVREEPRALIRR